MAMKVDVRFTHIIKPSSPTPYHQKNFKFSLLDQLVPSIYTPLLLFYKAASGHQAVTKSQQLKTSLSQVLVPFHPFAGRINDNVSIDCNDDGVPYSEAHVSCSLRDILVKPDPEITKHFLPISTESKEPHTVPLLVQANFFECGGMAIGVCASHKIADAATLSTFINAWSLGPTKTVLPEFVIGSLFPPIDFLNAVMTVDLMLNREGLVTKRYVFDASSIAALKVKAALGALKPTRVEAVSALIWKCAMTASRSISKPKKKPSVLSQAVNMRKRFVPPLPENSIGNFAALFTAHKDESEIELGGLVGELKKGLVEFSGNTMKKMQSSERNYTILESLKWLLEMYRSDDTDLYGFSSWCGFHFYDADFGWGKPTWVATSLWPYKNIAVLMDTKGGDGIEVLVNLKEQHMVAFEKDQDLLAFASANPSA